jgi:hypothetical protein
MPDTAWVDAPLSAGRWTYGARAGATFGPAGAPALSVRCTAPRRIAIERPGAESLTFRTSAMMRTVAAGAAAALDADDPLLDALAFSRGRFAVEAPGQTRLIVPAWPELARVVEDCRR